MKKTYKDCLLSTLAILLCLVFLFPIYWIIISSLKTNAEIFQTPQTFWPRVLTFKNYIDQLHLGDNSILFPLRNSLIISLGGMVTALLLGIPAAYGLVRFKMNIHLKKSIIFTFLVTQMLPVSLVLTPLFLFYAKLKLLNTLWAPMLSCATLGIPFIVLILRPYFLTFPKSIEDSARIDGCSLLGAFVKIVIPVTSPGIITAASFSFIFSWNDLIYSMTFNSDASMRPLTAGVYHFMSKYGTEWNRIMAYGMILVFPVLILFILLQRYVVSGLTAGAVKS